MTWLFSRALMQDFENSRYSQAQAAESSADICLDGEPLPLLSVMPTPQPFWRNDKPMDICARSPFGLTSLRLTEDLGAELLTWFLEDSRARTSASLDAEQVSTESAAVCGRTWPASLARYDHVSHSLKTAQFSLLEDSTGCFVTLPRSGSMLSGECFLQPTLTPPTSEKGSGLWPTPTASAMPCEGTVRLCRQRWLDGDATLEEASAIAGRDVRKAQGKVPAWFPTPTATATAYKGWSPNHNRSDTDDRIDYTIEREAHESGTPGRLNPMWEEWLMAWPIGWTQLKPLETDRWQEWQQQHSIFFAGAQDGDA